MPISNEAGEVLNLISKAGKSSSGLVGEILESSAIALRRLGQSAPELLDLMSIDLAAAKQEAEQMYRKLNEGDLREWRSHIAKNPPSADAIAYLLLTHEKKSNSERAKRSVSIKNIGNHAAKSFVQSEWAKYENAYKGNKTAFARDYVPRVAQGFKDAKGDPLKITEKQMREVWLANTPSASKRAG